MGHTKSRPLGTGNWPQNVRRLLCQEQGGRQLFGKMPGYKGIIVNIGNASQARPGQNEAQQGGGGQAMTGGMSFQYNLFMRNMANILWKLYAQINNELFIHFAKRFFRHFIC